MVLPKALRSGGVLYVTVEVAEWGEVREAYERAKALGLPVVYGEVVEGLDAAFAEVMSQAEPATPSERADLAVYHYYPAPEQVRAWLDQAGLAIEEEGTGDGYAHVLARKKA